MECCVCIGNGNATSFRTNSSLQAHIATAHCKPNLYMCDGCLKSFVSEYGLLKHSQNSCGKGFRTAELDARIAGKLELYQFMEKSVNVSLNKKFAQEQHLLSPNKKSKVVSIRGKAESVLYTQLQEEHPGSSNEHSADTSLNYHNPEVGSSDVPDQSSQKEPEPNIQTESETQVESGCHAENAVSSDYLEAFSDEDDVVVVEENIKHYGENKDQSKESIALGGSKKEFRENPGKTARPSRRQTARAQAIAAGIVQVNPGGMPNPKEMIPHTFYKNYATNINNKSSVGHRIVVSELNTEGLKESEISEMLKEYFDQFGEINQAVIIRNPVCSKSGTTIIALFAIFDGYKYLITFADRRITYIDEKTFSKEDYRKFFIKCTERSFEQSTKRYDEERAEKNTLINRARRVGTSLSKTVQEAREKVPLCTPNLDQKPKDQQKLFKFYEAGTDRQNAANMNCAVGIAGTQKDIMDTWSTIDLPGARSTGAAIGERLFLTKESRTNTGLLVSSRNVQNGNVLSLEMVYVCRCVEADVETTCTHARFKRDGTTREHFVCEPVTSWIECIGSGGDCAKKLLNDKYGKSLTEDGLAVRGVSEKELLNFVRKEVYKQVSEFDDHTGQETQAVLLCEDAAKNKLVNFDYSGEV